MAINQVHFTQHIRIRLCFYTLTIVDEFWFVAGGRQQEPTRTLFNLNMLLYKYVMFILQKYSVHRLIVMLAGQMNYFSSENETIPSTYRPKALRPSYCNVYVLLCEQIHGNVILFAFVSKYHK